MGWNTNSKKVKKKLDSYSILVLYLGMKKRKKTMDLKNCAYSYCVNKKSVTIHHVSVDMGWDGTPKLFNSTTNLRYERSYFFRGDGVDRFLKNYQFVCDNPTNDFFVDVLSNKKLKSEFSWGRKTNGRLGITKDEFFGKVLGR